MSNTVETSVHYITNAETSTRLPRDAATVMLGTGMRPGEVFSLRWENILLKDSGGLFQSQMANPRSHGGCSHQYPPSISRLKPAKNGGEDRVFPAATESGHLEGGSAKNYHARALAAIKKAAAEKKVDNLEAVSALHHEARGSDPSSGCRLRRLHSRTNCWSQERNYHAAILSSPGRPQADAIERAFAKLTDGEVVVTNGGQHGTRKDSQQA